MPEEPQNNNQQPEPTPHFDTFSGQKNEPVNNTVPTPVGDGPMTNFAPNPVVNPELARIGDTMNTTQPPDPIVNPEKPKWFKQKKFIIGIAVAVILVLIGGGSVFAYTTYQSPKKVLTDAVVNAFTSKTVMLTGDMSVESKDLKVSVTISSKFAEATGSVDAKLKVTANGKDYSINGSGLVDKNGDLYFKVEKLAGIVAELKSTLGISQFSSQSEAIDKLVAKIDGTWIKVSSDDLKTYSEESAASKTCINDTIKKFKGDKAALTEVTDLYTKNPFILIDKELGQEKGSFGYQLKGSSKNLKTFLVGLNETKFYKALVDCDESFKIDTSDISTTDEIDKNSTFKIWVDVWSHQITKIEANDTTDGTTTKLTILPKFNQSVSVTAPATSITLTELQEYIQDLAASMYGSEF